jgi:hypothetical protein
VIGFLNGVVLVVTIFLVIEGFIHDQQILISLLSLFNNSIGNTSNEFLRCRCFYWGNLFHYSGIQFEDFIIFDVGFVSIDTINYNRLVQKGQVINLSVDNF